MPVGPVGEFGGGIAGGGSGAGGSLIGQQVAYSASTSNFTAQPTSTSTWLLASTTSGTSPSIILPNDGFTYRVELQGQSFQVGTAGQYGLAFGTSATALIAASTYGSVPILGSPASVVNQSVIGSGQTLNMYCKSFSGTGASFLMTFNATATIPFALAAYRVA
jgi:hypothetical protein